jgi:phosphatidylglycerophosphate synthase
MRETLAANTERRRLRNEVLGVQLAILVVLAALALAAQRALSLSELYAWKAVAAFVLGSALVLSLAIRHVLAGCFGAANRVTLARGGLVALLFGLVGDVPAPWVVVVIAGLALALDGLDGWLARRLRMESDFGARFDMETDALLLVALTVLTWEYGKAGPWILLAGCLRYGFVAAARVLPRLAGPLPASQRRKTSYVIQVIAVIVSLVPWVMSPLSAVIALLGLVLLTLSFSMDVIYLSRDRRAPTAQSPA